tara:strand:+ start:314 stop:1258 length:945 start_codon:yes stop_codon:yes gene_type:complete
MSILKSLLIVAVLALLGAALLYVVAPGTFVDLAISAERRAAGLEKHEVEIPGFTVQYLDSEGTGAPLLLLHGFGADKDNWTRVSRSLHKHYRVIAPDLPGYGESDGPTDVPYTIASQVERVRAFVTALGLTHVHIGGNSMGGAISAAYAAAYPNEVGSLWLLAPAGVGSAPTSELGHLLEASDGRNPLIAETPEEFDALIHFAMEKPPYMPAAVIRVLSDRAIAAQPLRNQQFKDIISEGLTLEPLISDLPIPTHILWGDSDRLLHVGGADVLARILPNASKTIMKDIGHLPMMEAPELSAEDYLRFRQTLSAT